MRVNGKISIAILMSISLVACRVEENPDAGDGSTPDASTFSVSGAITGQGINGVNVLLKGTSLTYNFGVETKADGKYAFANIKPGKYTIQPLKTGILFTPETRDIEVTNAAVTVPDIGAAFPEPMTCDDAGTWCRPRPAVSDPMYSLWSANGLDLWFVGSNKSILRYTVPNDKPPTWTRVSAGSAENYYAVWGNNSGEVWISGSTIKDSNNQDNSAIFHYTPAGTPEWRPAITSSNSDIQALWGVTGSSDVSYGGCLGFIGTLPGDGGSWQKEAIPSSLHIYGAYAASLSDQWIVGRYWTRNTNVPGPQGATSAVGFIYRKQDGGIWKNADSTDLNLCAIDVESALTGGAWVSDIRGSNASDIWAVGTKGFVSHFDGKQWKLLDAGVDAGTNFYGVWPVSANEVWLAGGNPTAPSGYLVKYTNKAGAVTWQLVAVPSDAGVFYRVKVDTATNSVWLVGTGGILRYKP